jgi:hypothetical protein
MNVMSMNMRIANYENGEKSVQRNKTCACQRQYMMRNKPFTFPSAPHHAQNAAS